MSVDEQRKYIHDLANSISVLEASVARALRDLKSQHPEMTETIARLEKANEYSQKTITTLRAFREYVHSLIPKE